MFWNATGHGRTRKILLSTLRESTGYETEILISVFRVQAPNTNQVYTILSRLILSWRIHFLASVSGQAIHFIERSSPGWSCMETIRRYARREEKRINDLMGELGTPMPRVVGARAFFVIHSSVRFPCHYS